MLRTLVVLTLSLAAIDAAALSADEQSAKRLETAKTLVTEMAAGNFDKAVEAFDPQMQRALPAAKLKEVWTGVTQQYGELQRATRNRTVKTPRFEVVFLTCEFQQWCLDAKVVFTPDTRVTGLFFVPTGQYKAPAYADTAKFEEQEIQLGKGAWILPGTLTLPRGDGPFPAVVLVHGSGPQDRDESIGPAKPFRDLAQGLASQGIAALRYEKRTKHYATMTALSASTITVKEETIDDAAAAVDALLSEKKIDPKRIFVLGHSLGGTLLPRIARANNTIAGFISLAGSTRRMEDVVLAQSRYLLSLSETSAEETQRKLKELEQQVANVKSPTLSGNMRTSELPLGVPARYWLDLREYDPAAAAGELSKPMLFVQGERDYQVTMEDFAGWKKTLGSRKNVAFISYPKLNHLFVEGQNKSVPAEYSLPGNVAKVVIDDIANWIKAVP